MWGGLIRPLAAWLAKNWAGLAAGWAIGDIVTPDSGVNYADPTAPKQPGQVKEMSAIERGYYWLKFQISRLFGGMLPNWLIALFILIGLYYVSKILDKVKK
jgi:hypothetical protein